MGKTVLRAKMINSSESDVFSGSLYFSGSSESYAVKIYLGFDGINFVTEKGEEFSAYYENIKLGLGGFENRQLQVEAVCSGEKEVLCFITFEEKDRFLKKCETIGHGIDRKQVASVSRNDKNNRRLFWVYTFLAFFLLVVGAGLFYVYSKPFAKFIVSYLPVEHESLIGELSAKNLLADKNIIERGELYDKIHSILKRVETGIVNSPFKFKLYLANDSTVNAMAAPGGHVIVFTGILQNIESSEELAGILAHECAHVIHRHSMVRIVQNTISISMAFSLLSGIGIEGVLAELSASAIQLAYSRDDEREADETGINILHRAGIDPKYFSKFFERQRQKKESSKNMEAVMSILSTHPSDTERTLRLNNIFKSLDSKEYTPINPDYDQIKVLLNNLEK